MSENITDLKFFTNEENNKLSDRFSNTLEHAQFFDILVGYFRTSGFHKIYKTFENIEKIRILVGLSVDKTTYEIYQTVSEQLSMDFESHKNTKKKFSNTLKEELEKSDDKKEVQLSINKFIEYIKSGKIEIRAYPRKNMHAKVYITRYAAPIKEVLFGSVITGSSNLSASGLVGQREFNVELKDRQDVEFALKKFEVLWSESVKLNKTYIDTIQTKTWLNDNITPYELYLKLIYEYLEEDINLEEQFDPYLPPNFLKLNYQKQAAIQAKKILRRYNGIFIADVVGLGKTYTTALLLQQLNGKTLVVCPPVLVEYWKESLFDFGVRSYRVESLGKLDKIIKKGTDKFDYIVIDEAHRFRNDTTQSYADILDICRNKKVILVSATPLNNTIDDIFSQLKLFQIPKRSTIPGLPNLEEFFRRLKRQLKRFDKSDPQYKNSQNAVSKEIRDKILKYIMVRRTRTDIINYFSQDLNKQGLTFPDFKEPERIIYNFTGELEQAFNKTIELLKQFKYTRYLAVLYLRIDKLSAFEKQKHKNIGGFMKGIVIKRLESSFYAFKKTINRFIVSYNDFIDMYDNGTVYISDKVNVYDLLGHDNFDKLENLIREEKVKKWSSSNFFKSFIKDLKHDHDILENIQNIWSNIDSDTKLDELIHELKKNNILKNKKIIIFTESKETGDYLYSKLIKEFPKKILFFSSSGARHTDLITNSTRTIAKDLIKSNYDPTYQEQKNDIKILISTDVLAEGINLHRSNIIINYDLPWNPTKVLQRSGRINRIGTKHKNIHIFNFFPTTQADKHLGLEKNIIAKIQMFHNVLGEDAKYLSDGEEIGSQELFNTLNNKKLYTGEGDDEDSELKYLEIIRKIRDEKPELFNKIKKLPKKANSGLKTNVDKNMLITFFRQGYLKKFYINDLRKVNEITFFDAIEFLECTPNCKRIKIPDDYFKMLGINKNKFELDTSVGDEPIKKSGGTSNIKYIIKRLKDKKFKSYQGFTDIDEEYISTVLRMFENGMIAKKTAQKIKKDIERELNPIKILNVLQNNIRNVDDGISDKLTSKKIKEREVILSGYLNKELK